jgi:hypothetical protein
LTFGSFGQAKEQEKFINHRLKRFKGLTTVFLASSLYNHRDNETRTI